MNHFIESPRANNASVLPPETLLIGFPICPFVARARIVAQEKGLALNVRYIDLANKPAWFLERSPTGTVPALDTGTHFIFESSVISEVINESAGPSLHPDAPLDRAVNRAWADYAANLLRSQYMMMICRSNDDIDRYRMALTDAMRKVEKVLTRKPFFNGEAFAIVDAAYAPLFVRCAFLKERFGLDVLPGCRAMRAWGTALLDRPSVQHVHGAEHRDALEAHMRQNGSVLLRHSLQT
ncbi:MAG: glutathione S-transferase family protein [Hydrogenophaga sp.]|jgi:glutathione S-transferase|nr:glutathione S-transferase family protein [Hydrogenophaga sp.]